MENRVLGGFMSWFKRFLFVWLLFLPGLFLSAEGLNPTVSVSLMNYESSDRNITAVILSGVDGEGNISLMNGGSGLWYTESSIVTGDYHIILQTYSESIGYQLWVSDYYGERIFSYQQLEDEYDYSRYISSSYQNEFYIYVDPQNWMTSIGTSPLRFEIDGAGNIALYKNVDGYYQAQYYSTWSVYNYLFVDGAGYNSRGYYGEMFTGYGVSVTGSSATVNLKAGEDINITQELHYSDGNNSVLYIWKIKNISNETKNNLKFIRGGDTYFDGSDSSYTGYNEIKNMVYVSNYDNSSYMGFRGEANSQADGYFAGYYYDAHSQAQAGMLSNTTQCDYIDAGYALQWSKSSLASGEIWEIRAIESIESGVVPVSSYVYKSGAVASPGSGSTLSSGNSYNITWNTSLLNGSTVTIYMLQGLDDASLGTYSNAINYAEGIVVNSIDNNGTYEIDLKNHCAGENYKVLVVDNLGNWDVSDGLFSISAIPSISISISTAEIYEGASVPVTVALSTPSGTNLNTSVELNITITTSKTEYNLTLSSGEVSKSIDITFGEEDVYVDMSSDFISITSYEGGSYSSYELPIPIYLTVYDTVNQTDMSITGNTQINEGGTGSYTVSVSNPALQDFMIPLYYSEPNRLVNPPSSVTIPAGQSSVSFSLVSFDDNVYNPYPISVSLAPQMYPSGQGAFEDLNVTNGDVLIDIVENDQEYNQPSCSTDPMYCSSSTECTSHWGSLGFIWNSVNNSCEFTSMQTCQSDPMYCSSSTECISHWGGSGYAWDENMQMCKIQMKLGVNLSNLTLSSTALSRVFAMSSYGERFVLSPRYQFVNGDNNISSDIQYTPYYPLSLVFERVEGGVYKYYYYDFTDGRLYRAIDESKKSNFYRDYNYISNMTQSIDVSSQKWVDMINLPSQGLPLLESNLSGKTFYGYDNDLDDFDVRHGYDSSFRGVFNSDKTITNTDFIAPFGSVSWREKKEMGWSSVMRWSVSNNTLTVSWNEKYSDNYKNEECNGSEVMVLVGATENSFTFRTTGSDMCTNSGSTAASYEWMTSYDTDSWSELVTFYTFQPLPRTEAEMLDLGLFKVSASFTIPAQYIGKRLKTCIYSMDSETMGQSEWNNCLFDVNITSESFNRDFYVDENRYIGMTSGLINTYYSVYNDVNNNSEFGPEDEFIESMYSNSLDLEWYWGDGKVIKILWELDRDATSYCTLADANYTTTIYPGWNVISLPNYFSLGENETRELFGNNSFTLYKYSQSLSNYLIYKNSPLALLNSKLSTFASITPNEAMWVFNPFPANKILPYCLDTAPRAEQEAILPYVYSQWALIAPNKQYSASGFADALKVNQQRKEGLKSNVKIMWKYNNQLQRWEVFTPDATFNQQISSTIPRFSTIERDSGVWVRVE